MTGLVYLKSNHKVIVRVNDVVSYAATEIIGAGMVRGIDLSLADFIIVESTTHDVGHTITDFTDKRSEIPPSPDEQIRQLQETVAVLQSQINA